jgi:hypothetical protein
MKNRNITFTILLVIASFALSPMVQAVSPAPDGGYPGLNTAEGQNALLHLTTGTGNTAVGWFSLDSVTTGSFNTGVGAGTLVLNTADSNTAIGTAALLLNTAGSGNTAVGVIALLNNDDGSSNTAIGVAALSNNTTGSNNTANGRGALLSNTTGIDNTANGLNALANNTEGDNNTATGFQALVSSTIGNNNTAIGRGALFDNTIGGYNTAIGLDTLSNNTTGSVNTAVGASALANNTTGGANIALGISAGENLTTGNFNIYIGNPGVSAESNTIRIGNDVHETTFIAGISGRTVPNGVPVIIGANGFLGTIVSSQRFKDQIKPMDKASEAVLALKPVTFRYKKELDPDGIPQFGLVAEEVAKVNPDLVARDAKGQIYTVRYEAVNAMLLNEFLKEHRKVETLEAALDVVNERLNQQDARIQKVSAQVEINKTAPRVVRNNP